MGNRRSNRTNPVPTDQAPTPIVLSGLKWGYSASDGSPGTKCLYDMNLTVTHGQTCLLIGANGAGKSTVLRVLGGKHLVPSDSVRILGRPAFHDTSLVNDCTLLSTNAWMASLGGSQGVPLTADLTVQQMIDSVPDVNESRKDSLISALDIDMDWRMHRVSDGQRRRVQILLGLIRPFKVLLLDEVTPDLDVCARVDLLAWLKREAETTGAAILYATHILDGLESWASHIAYLTAGKIKTYQQLADNPDFKAQVAADCPCPLLRTVEGWLRYEREHPETIKVVIPVDPNKKKVVMRTDNPFARRQPMYDYSH